MELLGKFVSSFKQKKAFPFLLFFVLPFFLPGMKYDFLDERVMLLS